jgi:CheY-like chemotaxis protein
MTTDRPILIVDDDVDVRESIGDALEDEGFHVAGAANGKEALELLRNDKLRPELILLDVMMPEMDGWAFRTEQRSDPDIASIPVIVFTAHGSPREVAEKMQAVGFLKKPLRLVDLLSEIDRLCRASAELRRPGGG